MTIVHSFWPKTTQNACFFAQEKIIENDLKGVKWTQNRSKPWAIVHAYFNF
jgi:hypothetical protein